MASRCTNVLPCGLPKHNHSHAAPGHDPPPCHTYIYIDNYTDQSLILLTTISCHLSAIQWITKMPINVFRQSRCLNTSDSICDLFKRVCDRNDRNDKGNGKSYVRANDRGLQISCHSCHLCHLGELFFRTIGIILASHWLPERLIDQEK